MSNEIGSRGEFIFAMLLSRRDAVQKSLFKPIFLGDKQPTVDFYVDLLNYPHKKGFFFANVKATTLGYTADGTKLKILVDKAELSELLKYPTPTYLFGIDAVEEKGYFINVNHINTHNNLNGLSVEYPINVQNISALWEEVKQFWDINHSIHAFTSKFN